MENGSLGTPSTASIASAARPFGAHEFATRFENMLGRKIARHARGRKSTA
jgi:hypothetical protein